MRKLNQEETSAELAKDQLTKALLGECSSVLNCSSKAEKQRPIETEETELHFTATIVTNEIIETSNHQRSSLDATKQFNRHNRNPPDRTK